MRPFIFVALALALATSPAAAQRAVSAGLPRLASPDTTRVYRLDIPAQPLREALADIQRQTGLRIELADPDATSIQAATVRGSLTAPAALRALLAGTGFEARFEAAETVLVMRGSSAEVATRELSPVVVIADAARGARYTARRTTTATRTDAQLRDVPQTITVLGRDV